VSGKCLSDLSAIGSIVDLLSRQGSDPARAWTQEAQVLLPHVARRGRLSFFDADVQPVQQIDADNAFVIPSELTPEVDRHCSPARSATHIVRWSRRSIAG
jgi:hypothetical protein